MTREFVWTLFAPSFLRALMFLCLMSPPAEAVPPKNVNELIVERLADLPGKELDMLTVEYPPGGESPPHRHDAYVLVYVLQGAVEMQIAGHEVVTLKAGETFIERPTDIHTVSRNASLSEPAKFLVVALKSEGRPLTREVKTGER